MSADRAGLLGLAQATLAAMDTDCLLRTVATILDQADACGASRLGLTIRAESRTALSAPSSPRSHEQLPNVAVIEPPDSTRAALVRLFQVTNGGGWRNRTNWLAPSSVCSWHGVVCLVRNGELQVTNLHLDANNLTGVLPPDIFSQLPFLEVLFLDHNNIQGNLPSFSALALVSLSLWQNAFTGPVPDLNCTRLKLLDLSFNQLSGSTNSTRFRWLITS